MKRLIWIDKSSKQWLKKLAESKNTSVNAELERIIQYYRYIVNQRTRASYKLSKYSSNNIAKYSGKPKTAFKS